MFGRRHVCLRRLGHRPRQLIDGVSDVVASHLSEVHYAAHDSLETSLVFFVQKIFVRLVDKSYFPAPGVYAGLQFPIPYRSSKDFT